MKNIKNIYTPKYKKRIKMIKIWGLKMNLNLGPKNDENLGPKNEFEGKTFLFFRLLKWWPKHLFRSGHLLVFEKKIVYWIIKRKFIGPFC